MKDRVQTWWRPALLNTGSWAGIQLQNALAIPLMASIFNNFFKKKITPCSHLNSNGVTEYYELE